MSVGTASVRNMDLDLDLALDDVDAEATLAAVEESLLDRRRAEASDLALAAPWAVL